MLSGIGHRFAKWLKKSAYLPLPSFKIQGIYTVRMWFKLAKMVYTYLEFITKQIKNQDKGNNNMKNTLKKHIDAMFLV
jgi:hypothetical protein